MEAAILSGSSTQREWIIIQGGIYTPVIIAVVQIRVIHIVNT
jgi:hypothetical protein